MGLIVGTIHRRFLLAKQKFSIVLEVQHHERVLALQNAILTICTFLIHTPLPFENDMVKSDSL